MSNKVKTVLIVDDSALIRQLLTSILSSDPELEVVGAANDPFQAREMIKTLNPDVITLDVEMPKMDGLSFLEKIMRLRPMPVVMVSSLTQKNAEVTLSALALGAVDFVGKPTIDLQRGMEQLSDEIIGKVKIAANAKVAARSSGGTTQRPIVTGPGYVSTEKIVAIGSSTGGVEALGRIITALPTDAPAVLITQHMPASFTANFAKRLDSTSSVSVVEAENGARVLPGHVYIAKGDIHLELGRSGGNYVCKFVDSGPVSGHKPSVDVLFNSVSKSAGQNAIGVILTGMGRDGAEGLKVMRDAGAVTLGQDQATSLVYGMPRVAMELGGVMSEVPLSKMAEKIIESCGQRGTIRI